MAFSIISMADVVQHPLYEKVKDKENALDGLLYSMGMDIEKNYEVSVCEHRSDLTGQVNVCERFCGEERTDENWLAIKKRI